jgi:hypothetical protein
MDIGANLLQSLRVVQDAPGCSPDVAIAAMPSGWQSDRYELLRLTVGHSVDRQADTFLRGPP